MGDSDVGKQEIISGMEDGSLDSPYCSSTGAGTLQGPWTHPTVVQQKQVPYLQRPLTHPTVVQQEQVPYLQGPLTHPTVVQQEQVPYKVPGLTLL